MSSRPPDPHTQRFQAAVLLFGGLDVSNDSLVRKWKTEIDSVIEDMKICWENLLPNLRDKEIQAFRDTEREAVTKEKAEMEAKEETDVQGTEKGEIEEAERDPGDGRPVQKSLVDRRRSA